MEDGPSTESKHLGPLRARGSKQCAVTMSSTIGRRVKTDGRLFVAKGLSGMMLGFSFMEDCPPLSFFHNSVRGIHCGRHSLGPGIAVQTINEPMSILARVVHNLYSIRRVQHRPTRAQP